MGRAIALAAAALIVGYPVRAFLVLGEMPLAIRLCWPLLLAAALFRPRLVLLAFVGAAPLLPIVPTLLGWGRASLAEMWLLALLAAALLRVAAGRRSWRAELPGGALLMLALVSASLVAHLFPYRWSHEGWWPFLASLHAFLRDDFIVAASQVHFYAAIVSWAVVVEGLLLLWLVASEPAPHARRWAAGVLAASAAGSVAVSGFGLVQWWTRANLLPFWIEQDPAIVRINATMSDVNALGSYLALMIWLVLAAGWAVRSVACRWACRLAAVATALALVFTGSRAAWAALAVGSFLYVWGLARCHLLPRGSWVERHLPRLLAVAALGGLLLVGSLTAYATMRNIQHREQRSYLDTILYSLNLQTPLDVRLKGRLALWEGGMRMIAARPVFGIGIGRFYKDVYSYAPRQEALMRPQENAHNYFLQVTAELGLTGGVCFVALLVGGVAAAWRAARHASEMTERRFAVAAGVGIVAFAITLVSGHPLLLREGQFALWPVVGAALLLAGQSVATGDAREAAAAKRRRSRVLAILTAAIVVSVPFRASYEASRVNLAGRTAGLYDFEHDTDGRVYRWTKEEVTIYVPATARVVLLPLRALAPYPQTVTVFLDGERADELRLVDHDWHVARYLLPRSRHAPRFRRIVFRVAPTWTPAGDTRSLGVVLGEVSWLP